MIEIHILLTVVTFTTMLYYLNKESDWDKKDWYPYITAFLVSNLWYIVIPAYIYKNITD